MDKLDFKKRVMDEAVRHQESIVSDFRQRIKEIKEGDQQPQDEPAEYDQLGQEDESAHIVNRIGRELDFVIEELNFLKQMRTSDNILDEVTLGAVVKTDSMTFFPSVSLEQFEVDGHTLIGISKNAPLYKEMKGKKKGETFSLNGKSYKILDLY